jgi:hypothetical protein
MTAILSAPNVARQAGASGQVFRWYEAIRGLGLDVDFVPPGATLENYRLVLACYGPELRPASVMEDLINDQAHAF